MLKDPRILLIGCSDSLKTDHEAAHARHFSAAKKWLSDHSPSLMVMNPSSSKDLKEFCQWATKNSPTVSWIVSTDELPPKTVRELAEFEQLHNFVDNESDPTLELKVREALESRLERMQSEQLIQMIQSQSDQLQRLNLELESRVEKRQKSLKKSMRILEETKIQLESLHKAILGIHQASSITQMESSLKVALQATMELDWVKIRFESQSGLNHANLPLVLKIEIPFPSENLRGEVFFAKRQNRKFDSDEIDFLTELSEALGLALSRLSKLEQAETVKAQWQATFDSIPHPLCTTNHNFEILKLNRAFQAHCQNENFKSLIGRNCFTSIFGSEFTNPAELGDSFTFRTARTTSGEVQHFEVVGQTVANATSPSETRLIVMRDISDEVRIERRILESSKMAELGTIGSSIAHELNNPLGGMLSFLQLILMDLNKDHPLRSDVVQMEAATLRCRDIIQNLLSFARKQDLGEFTRLDLREVVERSAKLIELQSKSRGIKINITGLAAAPMLGSANALTQVLCNLLQNSIDSISDKLKENPLYPGEISISLNQESSRYRLTILDNGMGIRAEHQSRIFNPHFTTRDPSLFRGMGLTVAFSIVVDHHGTLELLSHSDSGASAILTLSG